MSSLGDVGSVLRQVLDKIDQSIAAHQHAADLAEEARSLLTVAGAGSTHGDVEQACATFTLVVEEITEPEGQVSVLAHAAGLIRQYAAQQGITDAAPSPASLPTAARLTPSPPEPGSPKHVAALRGQLPPQVARGTGQRTHGRWFGAGQREASAIVSGQAPESVEAWELLKATDFPESGPPVTVTHVETKVAVAMRLNGIQHATVVLNHVPCRDRYGCDTVVPVLLPEGSTLTVYAPNYRKTFTGGMRAPWQR